MVLTSRDMQGWNHLGEWAGVNREALQLVKPDIKDGEILCNKLFGAFVKRYSCEISLYTEWRLPNS